MKFDPRYYMTRCGAPWRPLDVEGMYAIAIKLPNRDCEIIMVINKLGEAENCCGERVLGYDLLPIEFPTLELPYVPKGIKYLTKDQDGGLAGWRFKPKLMRGEQQYQSLDVWSFDIAALPKGVSGAGERLTFPDWALTIDEWTQPYDFGLYQRVEDTSTFEFVIEFKEEAR